MILRNEVGTGEGKVLSCGKQLEARSSAIGEYDHGSVDILTSSDRGLTVIIV